MANIERAIKAALAKRGLEFSLKDETLYLGHCIKNGEDVLVVPFSNRLWAYNGKY
jgi:hypothetical protein